MESLKRYEFTTNWFDATQPQWNDLITKEGFPNRAVNILEIGSFEGRSTIWMLENLCTHPNSRLTTIDTFQGNTEHFLEGEVVVSDVSKIEARFISNIKVSGRENQVRVLKGRSLDRLVELNAKSEHQQFDFIYVDGSHNADDTLSDAVLTWPLLKDGGILIFDDYEWFQFKEEYNNPRIGIDAFLRCFSASIDVLIKNYQVTIRKVKRERTFGARYDYVQQYDQSLV